MTLSLESSELNSTKPINRISEINDFHSAIVVPNVKIDRPRRSAVKMFVDLLSDRRMNPYLVSDEALRRSTSEWISKVQPPQRAASEPDRVSVSDPFPPPPPYPATLIDFASACTEAVVPTPAGSGDAAVSPWTWSAPIGRDGVTCRPITANGSSNLKSTVGSEEFRDAFDPTNSIPTRYGGATSRTSLQNGKTKGYSFQTDGHDGISRPPSETAVLQRRPTKRNWSGSGGRKGRRRREEGDPGPLLDHRFKSVSGPSIRVLSNEFVHNHLRSLPNNSDSLLHRKRYFAADPTACPVLSGSSVYVTPSEAESPSKADQTQSSGSVPVQSAGIYLREQIISFFQPSDNKLAMKLFGTKKALMVEKLRQKDAARWIIHPCSNFR